MVDLFDGQDEKLYYSPNSDRLFIFKTATFLEMPCLEREDGKKMIMEHPNMVFELCDLGNDHRYKLEYIGEL